jgi:membrane protease YdiL (CAAX protease family)
MSDEHNESPGLDREPDGRWPLDAGTFPQRPPASAWGGNPYGNSPQPYPPAAYGYPSPPPWLIPAPGYAAGFAAPPAPWLGAGGIPWGGAGYSYNPPPVLPPVIEAPGKLHPPSPRRPFFSRAGRASPRLYTLGLLLGIPGVAALGWLEVASRIGWTIDLRPYGGWLVVEAIAAVAVVGLIASALAQTHQRHADGWSDYFGASPLLVVALVLSLNEAVGLPIAELLNQLSVTLTAGAQVLVATVTLLLIYVAVVHFMGVLTGALSWHEVVKPHRLAIDAADWQNWPGADAVSGRVSAVRNLVVDIGLPLVLLIPLLIVTVICVAILVAILGHDVSQASSPVSTTWTESDGLLIFIAAAVVAPIGEEIFFRGFVATAWARSLDRRKAITWAALFFAAIHIYNVSGGTVDVAIRAAILAFAARVPVSFVINWLYIGRRSIFASAAMHMLYNGALILIALSAIPSN